MSRVEGAGSCPARGRRYSAGQRKEILEVGAEHGDAAPAWEARMGGDTREMVVVQCKP